jgi:hypothetical protein
VVKVKCWGTAGDGARALLPWTAGPGAQRTLIPSTSSRRTPRAETLAAPCVFNTACVYLWVSARCSHPPADSPPSLLSARSLCNVDSVVIDWAKKVFYDSVVIDWAKKVFYVLEFKHTSDQRRDYRERRNLEQWLNSTSSSGVSKK